MSVAYSCPSCGCEQLIVVFEGRGILTLLDGELVVAGVGESYTWSQGTPATCLRCGVSGVLASFHTVCSGTPVLDRCLRVRREEYFDLNAWLRAVEWIGMPGEGLHGFLEAAFNKRSQVVGGAELLRMLAAVDEDDAHMWRQAPDFVRLAPRLDQYKRGLLNQLITYCKEEAEQCNEHAGTLKYQLKV